MAISTVRNPSIWYVVFLSITAYLFGFPAHGQYGGGTGEPNDPYLIYTDEQLNEIGLHQEDWDKHYKLMADIDLSGFNYSNALIAPDTNDATLKFDGIPFSGNFDGNGCKILHLIINGKRCLGLFGELGSGSEVKNLGLVNIKMVHSGSYAGGLAGYNRGRITNCYSIGYVSEEVEASSRGGLVGYNAEEGTIADCYSNSSIAGFRSVGELVGTNCGRITGCYSTGNVQGGWGVGGLVGDNKGTITDCYSTAQFCQWIGDPATAIWPYCFGGLVGLNSGIIENCYSTGGSWGLEPYGPIEQLERLGGLVGTNYRGNVIRSFWDMQASGLSESAGGVGLTTLEMKTASTFLEAEWDFMHEVENGIEDMWWILEGQSYPRLRRQYGLAFSHYPQNRVIHIVQDINEPVFIVQPVGIIQPIILNWLPGGSGLYHDVYFGEDVQAVTNATTESPNIYRGRQEPEMTTYDPGILHLDQTYYWRIDEINEADPISLPKGNVLCFTTANFIVVDDFESYDVGNPIWWAWKDGLAFLAGPEWYYGNGTGSIVGDNTTPSYTEETIVHGGFQSMPYSYDNNKQWCDKYSEAEKTLIYPRDWTEEDVTEFSLWFRGSLSNDPEPMYVAIANRTSMHTVVYHDDPNAVRIDTWTEWVIPLQRFADQGIDLTDVDRIAIGFGTRGNKTIPGGRGKMYFDDIRLYPPATEPGEN